jgi:ABC-2 type transport system permease protein
MFKKLFAMLRIGFLLEFAYPISFLFFIVLPLIFTAAVGAGLSGMMAPEDEAEPEKFSQDIFILSEDKGALVNSLMDALAEYNLSPQLVASLPEDKFALQIPADFSENLLEGSETSVTLHVLPTTSTSQPVEQYISAAISRLGGAAMVAEMGLNQAIESEMVTSEREERAYFEEILSETLAASKDPLAITKINWAGDVEITTTRTSATSAEQASAGQIVTWTQITLLAAAEVFVAEREGGTLRRLLVSPVHRSVVLGGKLLSRLVLGLVQMAVLFLGGSLLFGVHWGQDPLALIAVSLAFALATVGLGMLVATIVKSRGQANSIVIGLAMGLSALGGAWYPLEITPPLYRQIVQILPSTWAMRAYTNLLVQNASLLDVLPAVAVLMAFAAIFIVIGALRFHQIEQDVN